MLSLGPSAILFLPELRDLGDPAAPGVSACCCPRGALLDVLRAVHEERILIKVVFTPCSSESFLSIVETNQG